MHAWNANPFAEAGAVRDAVAGLREIPALPGCFAAPPGKPAPPRDASGLTTVYPLDPASLFPVRFLDVLPGFDVLDLCAAPGGKSLEIMRYLGGRGRLVANELSRGRFSRMRRVFDAYLPPECRKRVETVRLDAAAFCMRRRERFDRVLVDAPCSSERHLVKSDSELSRFSPARSRSLTYRQYAMLVSGFRVLKPGGLLVYATCSISPGENEGVIRKFLKKYGCEAAILPVSGIPGESAEFGWMMLPDLTGWGPLFFSVIGRRLDDQSIACARG
jgi:16S rRNA C967 or C1407 C5-methylase (RsmB/RsmF family)